jgi:hypothetical protein
MHLEKKNENIVAKKTNGIDFETTNVLVKCWGWDVSEIMLQNSTGYLVYEAGRRWGLFVDIGNTGVY